MLRSQQIKTRLTLGFGLMIVFMAMIGAAALWALDRSAKSLATIYEDRTIPLAQLGRFQYLAGRDRMVLMDAAMFPEPGRVAKRLIGDETRVEKEYLVRVAYTKPGRLPDARGLQQRWRLERPGTQEHFAAAPGFVNLARLLVPHAHDAQPIPDQAKGLGTGHHLDLPALHGRTQECLGRAATLAIPLRHLVEPGTQLGLAVEVVIARHAALRCAGDEGLGRTWHTGNIEKGLCQVSPRRASTAA